MCVHMYTSSLSYQDIKLSPIPLHILSASLVYHSNISFFMPHFRGSIIWHVSQMYLSLNLRLSITWRVILNKLNFANTTKGRLERPLASPFFPYSCNANSSMLQQATSGFYVKYKAKSQHQKLSSMFPIGRNNSIPDLKKNKVLPFFSSSLFTTCIVNKEIFKSLFAYNSHPSQLECTYKLFSYIVCFIYIFGEIYVQIFCPIFLKYIFY